MIITKIEESRKSFTDRALTSLRAVNLFSSSLFFHVLTEVGDKFSFLLSILSAWQSSIWILLGTAFLTYLLLRHFFI